MTWPGRDKGWWHIAAALRGALALAGAALAQQGGGAPAGEEDEPAATTGADGPAAEAEAAQAEGGETGAPADGEPAGDGGAAGEDGPLVVDEEEGSVLDDQTFEGEEDDFIPSQEIPVDEPIPFPSDI